MHPHDVIPVRGEQAVQVGVAQVLLDGEGQQTNILEGLNVLGLDAQLVHLSAVEGAPGCIPGDGQLQPAQLQGLHVLAAHALMLGVPNPGVRFIARSPPS